MKSEIIILLAALLATGCESTGGTSSKTDRAWSKESRAAAKASVTDPSLGQPSNAKGNLNVCTIVKGDTIKLINFTDQPIVDANIWIEGKFVSKVASLPAQGSITLNKGSFVDHTGQSLASAQNTNVTRVMIEQPDGGLYGTLAPVTEQ